MGFLWECANQPGNARVYLRRVRSFVLNTARAHHNRPPSRQKGHTLKVRSFVRSLLTRRARTTTQILEGETHTKQQGRQTSRHTNQETIGHTNLRRWLGTYTRHPVLTDEHATSQARKGLMSL